MRNMTGRSLLIAGGMGLLLTAAACGRGQQNAGRFSGDYGLRPKPNGFQFANYAAAHSDGEMSAAELRRMFGDGVCRAQGADCQLTTVARTWLRTTNRQMRSVGHCEGMAVLSALMFNQHESPSKYEPGAAVAYDLDNKSAPLLKTISYYWATQKVPSVNRSTVQGTPAEVLDQLMAGMKTNTLYTVGIYPRQVGGHAVTPYAVEDRGGGLFRIHVYDNNFPGEEKYIEVDKSKNTWVYATAAQNPKKEFIPWDGDATTRSLEITPIASRLGLLPCPFCAKGGEPKEVSVSLDGRGSLVVTDPAGRRTGEVNGQPVIEIPGSRIERWRGQLTAQWPPRVILPTGTAFRVAVAALPGEPPLKANLEIVQPGGMVVLRDLTLHEQPDAVDVSADGQHVAIMPGGGGDTPLLELAVEQAGDAPDYLVSVGGVDVEAGEELSVDFDSDTGQLALSGLDDEAHRFDLEVVKDDASGEYVFEHADMEVPAGAAATLDFGAWDGDGEVAAGVDYDADGTVDQLGNIADEDVSGLPTDDGAGSDMAAEEADTASAETPEDPGAANDMGTPEDAPAGGTEELPPDATAELPGDPTMEAPEDPTEELPEDPTEEPPEDPTEEPPEDPTEEARAAGRRLDAVRLSR